MDFNSRGISFIRKERFGRSCRQTMKSRKKKEKSKMERVRRSKTDQMRNGTGNERVKRKEQSTEESNRSFKLSLFSACE